MKIRKFILQNCSSSPKWPQKLIINYVAALQSGHEKLSQLVFLLYITLLINSKNKYTDKSNLSVLHFIYRKGVIYIGTNKVCPSFLKSFVYNRYLFSILSENFRQNSSSDL